MKSLVDLLVDLVAFTPLTQSENYCVQLAHDTEQGDATVVVHAVFVAVLVDVEWHPQRALTTIR